MPIDSWLPIGFTFGNGVKAKQVLREGVNWQIYETDNKGRVLLANEELGKRWVQTHLLEATHLEDVLFGSRNYYALFSFANKVLAALPDCNSPKNKNEAVIFAEALKFTRDRLPDCTLQDAIYTQQLGRILPTFGILDNVGDDFVLGSWLSGGIPVSVNASRRIRSLTNWLSEEQLGEIIAKAGLSTRSVNSQASTSTKDKSSFELAGRPNLEHFFNEHVIDIVENQERYRQMGIEFPSAIILHGPPGCGKTFAVEKLVEYLEWPCFQIEASSVASPYIHETSRKVASLFEAAISNAPSVIVIDEMEAFLTDRQVSSSSGQHRVEEMAEFLRRIPEAIKSKVLVIGMTNKIDMIDPAILRRGRFDHIIKVDMASETEVYSLLEKLLSSLPHDKAIDLHEIAKKLCDRPLSDVAFVIRESARIAARNGKISIDSNCVTKALEASPSREEIDPPRKIGFAT